VKPCFTSNHRSGQYYIQIIMKLKNVIFLLLAIIIVWNDFYRISENKSKTKKEERKGGGDKPQPGQYLNQVSFR